MMTRRALFLIAPFLLAGCGLREPLQPVEGQAPPPTPAAMARPLTTDEMVTPPPIARPERVDELLRRSEERTDDRFDLPPPEVPAGTIPVPDDNEASPQ
jgi:hypothetical protein